MKEVFVSMITAVLFIIAKHRNNSILPMHACINKMCYIACNEILLSLKMQWNSDIPYNVDEPWKHANWNKPDSTGQILCNTI